MKLELLARLNAARAAREPVVVVTHLETGEQELWRGPDFGGGSTATEAKAALRLDAPRIVEAGSHRTLIHPHNPPLRLVVVGAVHIAQSLVRMASETSYDVLVVDPREAFARATRFPGVRVTTDWPDEVLEREPPDARTAVVTLTHDPKLDDPALVIALKSDAFYVGALGSRRTHASRVQRLARHGLTDARIARLHGPVGLAIGARSPAEIAVSILAQMTQVLRSEPEPAEPASS